MGYSPRDIVNYIMEKEYESNFLTSLALHKGNYSIAELADKRFRIKEDGCRFQCKGYDIDVMIEDDEIITAVKNKMYITPFLSRKDNQYQVHFLVHQYPEEYKARFEDEIAKEVVDYMIIKSVIALRLDTPEKVEEYISN